MSRAPAGVYDVAVIGAGVVGLMISFRLAKLGKRVVVIEKERGEGMGVTAGQASVIHVLQLPFSSLKSKLARKGNVMYDELCKDLDVKLNRMTALLVVKGWLRLPVLFAAWLYLAMNLRGEFGTRLMRGKNLRKIDAELADDISAGIVVHGYGTVDSKSLVSKLREASERRGTEFIFGCEVRGAEFAGNETLLRTSGVDVKARFIVNASGLYSDDVTRMLGGDLGSHEPGLGVMAVYSGLNLHSIVAPLPISMGSRTKGGAIIPETDGTTIFGPTLRAASSKTDTAHTEEDLDLLRRKFGPLLKTEGKLVRVFSGMRPLSPTKDFRIEVDRTRRTANLVGIESPGLTAAPAIAEMVERAIFGDST